MLEIQQPFKGKLRRAIEAYVFAARAAGSPKRLREEATEQRKKKKAARGKPTEDIGETNKVFFFIPFHPSSLRQAQALCEKPWCAPHDDM